MRRLEAREFSTIYSVMNPSTRRQLAIIVAVLALGASVTSLGSGFAMDDLPVVLNNPRIHTLSEPWIYFSQTYWPPGQGPALYRPLTILAFAIEWAVGGGAPMIFHLVNTLCYAAASVVVLWLALEALPLPAAFLTAALFAVHPVHVEAVGNVVGQPEILVGILVSSAVAWYLHARRFGPLRARDSVLLGALYAAALLTKEHAIVLPGLIVCAELLVVSDGTSLRRRLEGLVPILLGFAAVLVGVWSVRTLVTGGLVGRDIHPAFRDGHLETRLWTMLGVVPEWLRLLLLPMRLSADYNPQEIPVAAGFGWRAFTGLAVLAIAAGLVVRSWRRRPVMAFGILWVVLTLFPVSNLLLPTGILLAERTLFLPSVGAMLAVGATAGGLLPALQSLAPARRTLVLAGLWTVVVVGLLRSALRQPVWRDNQTLFAQTVRDAPTSYKAVAAHAVMLLETGQDTAGLREYRTALSIYPDDPNLFLDLGNWYLGKGRCEDALESYARVLELAPGHWAATSRSVLCLIHLDRLDQARAMAQTAVSRGDEGAREKLAYVDSLIARRGARTGP
jgi:hypothetical protein